MTVVIRFPETKSRHAVLRLPEWVLAGCLFLLGAQLARTDNGFAVSHVYDVLARMANEKTWSMMAMWIGSIRLVALILNGFFPVVRRVTPVLRLACAFAGGCVWFAMTIGFVIENNLIVGIVAHAGLTFFDFSYAAIVAGEVARSEHAARNPKDKTAADKTARRGNG